MTTRINGRISPYRSQVLLRPIVLQVTAHMQQHRLHVPLVHDPRVRLFRLSQGIHVSTHKSLRISSTPSDLCIAGASLATECGITAAEFTEYNPSSTLCSTLTVGEYVCCSSGTLPDYAPSPYANGTCATYLVEAGDDCSSIAATYSLTVDELTDYNNDTWGWMGCADLQAGNNICLSTGYPPMPAVVANAVCGPQVPGTPVVPAGTNLSTLNQCPLNACCDIWGQVRILCSFYSPYSRLFREP